MIDPKRLAEIRRWSDGYGYNCPTEVEIAELVTAYEALRELVLSERTYEAVKLTHMNPYDWRDARVIKDAARDAAFELFPETPHD